jgi:PAB-dependent poly(A)-specific ribonuclease subunit 3
LAHPQQGRPRSINDIMPMIGARFYAQLEASQMRNDLLENELAKVRRYSAA